ncbi:MAG: RiPP maturation radical SAM C-methyltransferase [Dehalococcoidia bacterium]
MTTIHDQQSHTERARPLRVALVNMPFASTRYPSIQLGLMQSILRRHGIDAETHYLNLRFAHQLGWERYEVLCSRRRHLLGEWLFARAAFGEGAPPPEAFLEACPESVGSVGSRQETDDLDLLDLRERVAPAFIAECVERIAWDAYDVVGFGSIFEQNCAVLALARALKDRYPKLITVFGGSNFEDEMGVEYVRALPWVDYAVIGEGDEVFPALLDRLAAGEEPVAMPGVACRTPAGLSFAGRAPTVQDLDSLPEPDYHEFFDAAAELDLPGMVLDGGVVVPFESARGCWWGAKHHCTFCGLNGLGMAFRSKTPGRVLSEIDELASRHHVYAFEAVDNIMDHRYVKDVFGPLAEQHMAYTFFYEVKANLTPEQLRDLARGGVRRLQPGVESLSTPILKLMRKGTTAIQNVRLLKWALYYGIEVAWNVLNGFPGECPEDYERQIEVMRLIPHLQPPNGRGRIWLERYSPYFSEAEERGIVNIRPDRAYPCIYPGQLDLERIAYFFEYDSPGTLPDEFHEPLVALIASWQENWNAPRRPYLTYLRTAGRLTIVEGRTPGAPAIHTFDEHAALVYDACNLTHHGAARVLAHLHDTRGLETSITAVQRDLDAFTARGLMLEEDGHYLSLALPSHPYW